MYNLNLKQKIGLGILFLFLLLLLSGGLGIYYLTLMRGDAEQILKNNFESLKYSHAMQRQLDSFLVNPTAAVEQFNQTLKKQEINITEPGEKEATRSIRRDFEKFRAKSGGFEGLVDSLQRDIQLVLSLNMDAIERKNEQAKNTADRALIYISLIAALIFFVALGFLFFFPKYIASPIVELTHGIRAIAGKNYDQRIHIRSEDEFGEMAEAFNLMAQKLDEYEHSNLAQTLFEKLRAEAVINSLRDASIAIDNGGAVLFANEQALQLLNMPASDIIGKAPELVAARSDLFRFLLEPNQSSTFKIVVDGKENFFVRETNRIKREGGELGVVYTLKNITVFQEKDIAKTNFLATISHELKTPLASTDIGLKLLENNKTGSLTPEQNEIIQDLRRDNQRLIRLVSELLDVTQAEAGNINLNMISVEVEEVIQYAVETVKNQAKEKGVSIQLNIPHPSPRIKADKEKAAWVLINLLSNAIRYSPNHETVVLEVFRSETGFVLIVISDKGPGIPIEYQDQIFQRFFTVPGGQKGSGLGLAISKEFMGAMGGGIALKKSKGAGAVFELGFREV
ncbi:MAG: HAMP domain-containing protein [Haliscomenobacter sp.]|nr:HAMP domain-containing protein [Haliscomenobacter sp.]